MILTVRVSRWFVIVYGLEFVLGGPGLVTRFRISKPEIIGTCGQ